MSDNCIFCKIAKRELPANIIFENNDFLVFKDLHPKAAMHLLIIPKKHIESLSAVTAADSKLIGDMMLLGSQIAADQGLNGFRTVINTGKEGGQVVFHLHSHLLGGKNLSEFH